MSPRSGRCCWRQDSSVRRRRLSTWHGHLQGIGTGRQSGGDWEALHLGPFGIRPGWRGEGAGYSPGGIYVGNETGRSNIAGSNQKELCDRNLAMSSYYLISELTKV